MKNNGKVLPEQPEPTNVILRLSGEDEQDLYFSTSPEVVQALIALAALLHETPTKSAAPGVVMRVFVGESVTGEEPNVPLI